MDKNKLLVPGAIVIAGIVIAGAVFMSNSKKAATSAATASSHPDIVLQAVSPTDHILGSADASVVMVEFSDLGCPFCNQFHGIVHQIFDKYGKDNSFAWVFRQYPIPELHPNAPKMAAASECVAEQGGNDAFWKFVDEVYAETPLDKQVDPAIIPGIAKKLGLDNSKIQECLTAGKFDAKVADEAKQGKAAGGSGTPYSILVFKNPLSADALQFVSDTNDALLQQVRSTKDVFFASKDGKMVAVSGRFPFELMDSIISELIKK